MSARVRLAAGLGLALWSFASAWTAGAADSSAGVPLPALRADPPGSLGISEVAILVRNGLVREDFDLARGGDGGAAAAVIEGPEFGWLGEAEPYPDRQFAELQVRLDGVAVKPGMAFVASSRGKDISRDVMEAGLDPFAIAETPPLVTAPEGKASAAFGRLLEAGAVQKTDGQYWARWQARRVVRVGFGNLGEAHLSLVYQARPGFALLPFQEIGHRLPLDSYCLSEATLARRLGPGAEKSTFVVRTLEVAATVDGKRAERVLVGVGRDRAVFCGRDGEAVWGSREMVPVPARAGEDGTIRVVAFDPPG